ncbi:hypothetical protein LOTGIDRAFT_228073 [Lottia gigantea]|uniref:F-box domain-containing protein n=1 Tax=Lottia gigantea TaxID=225164 RepID=V4BHZ6_LOTGI|nr:hypothetical protein LOTGIDRAFT_228073 [Lottia gigantea]ESP05522.1 hypothetical protein LOTGIDRAFT_228073 [Lottia gigantea]
MACTANGSSELSEDVIEHYFPFEALPEDCKLQVFSYLNNTAKVRCCFVCKEWLFLLKSPRLWNHISLSDFTPICLGQANHTCVYECYKQYQTKVLQFTEYLCQIKPILHSFVFELDIYDPKAKFLPNIENFLRTAQCRELIYAHLNWKETPNQPLWYEEKCWYHESDVIHLHRLRHRKFVWFFDFFTSVASNLKTLIMPFGWSETSVEHLKRLQNLQTLVLEKYFVFKTLDQTLLDRVLEILPKLQRFLLEVWTPSGAGLLFYSLKSASLQFLDISQSRGFYLNGLVMPKLRQFCVARHPWNGPIVSSDKIKIPCLYGILVNGAPNLEKINDHNLEANWKEKKSPNLQEVLKSVCACKSHKRGWAM